MEICQQLDFDDKKLQKSVVPWYNPEQFKRVYECLFSRDITKKRWAVDQISVWETRSHPSLPTAIECSVGFTRAIIQDVLFINGVTLCQEADIQMMYAMALVRSVNLIIETQQSFRKMPLSQIAEQMDIPPWIVDLRNEVAHSHSPSLQVLRLGAEEVMKYLKKNYWEAELEKLKSVVIDVEKNDGIVHLINRYLALQFYILYGKKPSQHCKPSKIDKLNAKIQERKLLLRKVSAQLSRNRESFLQVLSMDGYFLPNEDDLKHVLPESDVYDLLEDDDDDADASLKSNVPLLPVELELLWIPMLRVLNNQHAIPDFVETLLYSQGDRSLIGQKIIIAWTMKLLRIASVGPKIENSPVNRIFCKRGAMFNWERLFYAAVANPCKYTAFIFPLITCHLDFKEDFVRSIMILVAISQGQALDDSFHFFNKPSVFTLEKLKEIKKRQDIKKKGKEDDGENIWSLAPENIDFKNIPIGAIICPPENEDDGTVYSFSSVPEDDIIEGMEVTEKFIIGNENDSGESMEGIITVQPNTFEIDQQIVCERKSFLYKKKGQ